jgi:hypothetical protein
MRKLFAVSFLCAVAAFVGGCSKSSNTVTGNDPGDMTWTIGAAGVPNNFMNNGAGIVWGNKEFLLVGADTSLTSVDGKSWVAHISNLSARPVAAAWGGATFVVITDSGIFSATDGAAWKEQFSKPSLRLCALTRGGTRFVAVGATRATPDTAYAFVSSDGNTWSSIPIGLGTPAAVAWGNNQFTALGNGVAYTSTDGAQWSQAFTTVYATDSNTAIAYGANLFVAVVGGYSTRAGLYTSPDGVNWTSRLSGTWGYDQYNTVVWNGSNFIVAGSSVLTSADGIGWTIHPDLPSGITITGMAAGNTTVVGLSGYGILTTP